MNNLYNAQARAAALRRKAKAQQTRAAEIAKRADDMVIEADHELATYFLQPCLPEWEKGKQLVLEDRLSYAQANQLRDTLWDLRSNNIRSVSDSFRRRGDVVMADRLIDRGIEISDWLDKVLSPRMERLKREEEAQARLSAEHDKMLGLA